MTHYGSRFLLALALVSACSNEPPDPREHVTALRGTITTITGAPISGAHITSGAATAISSAAGIYELSVPAGEHVVRFESDGYVPTFERAEVVEMSPTQLDVTLLAMAPGMPLDATAGGSVAGMRGATLTAPAGAFVDGAGAVVTGMVSVHLTAIDPGTDELAAAPGDFTALMAGAAVPLESFGMMDITVEQGGAELAVAPGAELEIRIPVAADAASMDPEVALWSFDEARGVWVDEGMAAYDAATGTYAATTHHMSVWNVDKPYLATCLCGTVTERGAGPLPGAHVDATGLDYFGSSSATTDASGRFCVAVRKSSQVSVAAYHASGGGTARTVSSGDADTAVPPSLGDARCADIGNIEVERDVFHGGDGMTLACADVPNPFTDACGSVAWNVFGCYAPAGACTYRVEGTSTVTMYANGARNVATGSASGGHMDLFGPGGVPCGSTEVGLDMVVHYTTPDGTRFAITVPEGATGDLVLTCPDGSMRAVSAAERQALSACSPQSGGSGLSACTPEASTMGDCTTDADCTAMMDGVCCAIPSAGNYCLPRATCDML